MGALMPCCPMAGTGTKSAGSRQGSVWEPCNEVSHIARPCWNHHGFPNVPGWAFALWSGRAGSPGTESPCPSRAHTMGSHVPKPLHAPKPLIPHLSPKPSAQTQRTPSHPMASLPTFPGKVHLPFLSLLFTPRPPKVAQWAQAPGLCSG